MFRLQRQFNNIVETTQLNNDQMPEFHCHCEWLKCSPPAPSYNTSLQSPYLRNLLQPCRSVPVVGCPDNLNCFLEFDPCFWLWFKLVVSLQHCTLYVMVHWVYVQRIWRPLVFFVMISGQLARIQFCALRGVARCVRWRAVLLEDESRGQPAIA